MLQKMKKRMCSFCCAHKALGEVNFFALLLLIQILAQANRFPPFQVCSLPQLHFRTAKAKAKL